MVKLVEFLERLVERSHIRHQQSCWSCIRHWSDLTWNIVFLYYSRDKVLLEWVQHRFTWMLPGLKQKSYFECLEHLGLWTLEERRNRADLLEVFRMYRSLSVTPFNQFFATSLLTNTRGHTAKIQKARCNLDVRRFFFSESRERVIDRWNRLQQEDIDVTLRLWIPSKQFLNVNVNGRWASLMDWWSAWPSGLICSEVRLQNRCGRTWYLVRVFFLKSPVVKRTRTVIQYSNVSLA